MSLNTTPRTWVAGEVVTAAELNTEVRDALTGIQAAWTAYTPAWTATTTNPAIGNGSIVASYMQVGKTVTFEIQLNFGTTTTYGTGTWQLTTPLPVKLLGYTAAGAYRTGGTAYPIWAELTAAGSTLNGRCLASPAAQNWGVLSGTNPATAASGGYLWLGGTYQTT